MKKWMLVIALVVGIMIGSLVNNPFQSDAQSVTIGFRNKLGYCFATLGESITYIKKGSCFDEKK